MDGTRKLAWYTGRRKPPCVFLRAVLSGRYTLGMPHRFDATLKSIVSDRPGDFATVFALPADKPVTVINVDLSTITASTDVALGYGEPVHQIVDLNFQSGPDATLPGRLLLYNAALHDRYQVAVRSVLVLLRPKADSKVLTGSLTYGEQSSRLEFHYEIVRLWLQPVDAYLNASLAVLPLATLCQMPSNADLPEALGHVVQEINRRLKAEADHAEAIRLMTAAYILTGLRVKKQELANIYRGIGLMQESTAYDEAVEDAEIKRSHRILLKLGQKQFGEPGPLVEAELKSIRDLDRLDRIIDIILTANSWEELLAMQ